MEKRREHLEALAWKRLKAVRMGDDVSVEVSGPSTQFVQMPNQPPNFALGYCFLLTLGHNLLGKPPITAPAVIPTLEIPDTEVANIVDQLLEAARNLRAKLQDPGKPGDDLGAALRRNPIKLG